MATTMHKKSAQIFEFPVGGRAGLSERNRRASSTSGDAVFSMPATQIVVGSGWYHDAAIEEEKSSKH
jgi:hypothetical protein